MSAPNGPTCVACGKKTSSRCVPHCIWCGRVVHVRCSCPLEASHKKALENQKGGAA